MVTNRCCLSTGVFFIFMLILKNASITAAEEGKRKHGLFSCFLCDQKKNIVVVPVHAVSDSHKVNLVALGQLSPIVRVSDEKRELVTHMCKC